MLLERTTFGPDIASAKDCQKLWEALGIRDKFLPLMVDLRIVFLEGELRERIKAAGAPMPEIVVGEMGQTAVAVSAARHLCFLMQRELLAAAGVR